MFLERVLSQILKDKNRACRWHLPERAPTRRSRRALPVLPAWPRRSVLKTIPDAVLGGLLLFSGIELALSSKLHEHKGGDLFLVLLMAAIGVALNPGSAFAVGLPIAYALQHEWIRV